MRALVVTVPEMERAVTSCVQALLFPEAEETETCHFDWHWILISNLSMASRAGFLSGMGAAN